MFFRTVTNQVRAEQRILIWESGWIYKKLLLLSNIYKRITATIIFQVQKLRSRKPKSQTSLPAFHAFFLKSVISVKALTKQISEAFWRLLNFGSYHTEKKPYYRWYHRILASVQKHFLHLFLISCTKAKWADEKIRRCVSCSHAVTKECHVSHITAAPTLTGLQAALPGLPQVTSEQGQGDGGCHRLLWEPFPTDSQHKWLLLPREMSSPWHRERTERQIAEEDYLFYTNISLYHHSSALELSVLLLHIFCIRSRVSCSN